MEKKKKKKKKNYLDAVEVYQFLSVLSALYIFRMLQCGK